MIRYYLALLMVFLVLVLAACQAGTPVEPTPTTSPAQPGSTVQAATPEVYEPLNACDNFFLPMENGTTWKYSDGTVITTAGFSGDDQTGNTVLLRLNPDATVEKLYIRCTNGRTEIVKIGTLDKELNEIGSKSMSEISGGKCESKMILPELDILDSRKSWNQCRTPCRVINDESTIIKLGSFKTRRIECEDGTVRWYAPQFGLIKTCIGKNCSELVEFRAPN
jgi:hypothetical protein